MQRDGTMPHTFTACFIRSRLDVDVTVVGVGHGCTTVWQLPPGSTVVHGQLVTADTQ